MLNKTISSLDISSISEERRIKLQALIDFIDLQRSQGLMPQLNFICTHNSRRSQLAQVWAFAMSDYFGVETNCFSGGVEVTAFNINAVNALKHAGFEIVKSGDINPKYIVSLSGATLECYSKLFDDESSPNKDFAAIMVCSHADENCPFVPGCDKRIGLTYEDPKAFDGTPLQTEKYQERSVEIATEMKYVFKNIAKG